MIDTDSKQWKALNPSEQKRKLTAKLCGSMSGLVGCIYHVEHAPPGTSEAIGDILKHGSGYLSKADIKLLTEIKKYTDDLNKIKKDWYQKIWEMNYAFQKATNEEDFIEL